MDEPAAVGSGAYSASALTRAVNFAAILGWAGFLLSIPIDRSESVVLVAFFALCALAVAFALSWLIGRPILKRLMRSPISYARAALWGGIIAVFLRALSKLAGQTLDYFLSIISNSDSRIGGADAIRSVDSILAPYGRMFLSHYTAELIVKGALVAMIIRLLIGPGQKAGT